MQLRKRTATLIAPYSYIYSQDPALDQEAEDFKERWEKALETNLFGELPLKAGMKPALWQIEHVRGDVKRYLQDFGVSHPGGHQLIKKACSLALCGVQELMGGDGTNEAIDKAYIDPESGLRCVAPDMMEQLEAVDDGNLVTELGLRVCLNMHLSKK